MSLKLPYLSPGTFKPLELLLLARDFWPQILSRAHLNTLPYLCMEPQLEYL